MKVPTARFGEHRMFEQIGLPIEGLGDGFSWKSKDLEHSAQLARDGWERRVPPSLSGEHFLVVLDEITYPLIYGWLPLQDVLDTLAARPKDACVSDGPPLPRGNHRHRRHGDRDEAHQARLPGLHSGSAALRISGHPLRRFAPSALSPSLRDVDGDATSVVGGPLRVGHWLGPCPVQPAQNRAKNHFVGCLLCIGTGCTARRPPGQGRPSCAGRTGGAGGGPRRASRPRWHPVVWMGQVLVPAAAGGSHRFHRARFEGFLFAALFWCALAAILF